MSINNKIIDNENIVKIAFASMIGSTIEWYDFIIYSQATALVFGRVFFPASDTTVSTLAGFATFAVGFAARPFGAIVFGHYGDRIGRKATLVATLTLMGLSTVAVGLLPTYGQVGIAAPLGLLALRLLQGFAVGGEWGGAVLLVVEHAPINRRGFFGSWPQLGVPVSLILVTSVLALLSSSMSDADFQSWGWRIPFLMSSVLMAVGLFIRLRVSESPEFLRLRSEHRELRAPAMDVLRQAKRLTLLTIGAQWAVNVAYYVITVFALSYATVQVGVPRTAALIALVIAALADLIAVPAFGALSDIVGRKPVMISGSLFIGLFAFPFFLMVQSGNPVLLTIALSTSLALGHAPVYSTISTFFAESYGVRSRYTGISVAYHVGSAVSSGPAPFIASALAAAYAGPTPVAIYMAVAAVVAVTCMLFLEETRRRGFSSETVALPTMMEKLNYME